MSDFYIDTRDGNFIIESGSTSILKVEDNTVTIDSGNSGSNALIVTGSIIPGSMDSGSIGTLEMPFVDLYVQSGSIHFADTSTHNFGSGDKEWSKMSTSERKRRATKFGKEEIDTLYQGKSLNDSGHISASGDMHVVGSTHLQGSQKFIGTTNMHGHTFLHNNTYLSGSTSVRGALDIEGVFKVNGTTFSNFEDLMTYIKTLKDQPVSAAEFAKLDGIGESTIISQLNAKMPTSNLVDEDNMASNSAAKVPSQQSVKAYADTKIPSSDLLDEDNMASNSATKPASQQSIKAYVDANAGGGGGSGNYDTGSHLVPHVDNTYDLGSSTKEWKNLYVDGIAYVDRISNAGNLTTVGLENAGHHILGGKNGTGTISSFTSPHVVDATIFPTFVVTAKGDIHGIQGQEVTGQIVTFICLADVTFHHQENGVKVGFMFNNNRNRDVIGMANTAIRFIYYATGGKTVGKWYRLL